MATERKNAARDENSVASLVGVSSVDFETIVPLVADPTTGRLLVDMGGIGSLLQTDVFTSTNGQTTFTASLNVAATIFLSVNGVIQTPNVDYTVSGKVATLTTGIPANNAVVWCYTTS